MADNNHWTYSSAQEQDLTFCHMHNLTAIPTSEETFSLFVAFLANRLTPQSIKVYLAGVWALHISYSHHNPLTHTIKLQKTLWGIKREHSAQPKRNYRSPLIFRVACTTLLTPSLKRILSTGPSWTLPIFYSTAQMSLSLKVTLPTIGSLSTRTFQGNAAVAVLLRLGRGLLCMTSPGLPSLSCRRQCETRWIGRVLRLVRDLGVFNVFIVCSPFSSDSYDFNGHSANFFSFCFVLSGRNDHRTA